MKQTYQLDVSPTCLARLINHADAGTRNCRFTSIEDTGSVYVELLRSVNKNEQLLWDYGFDYFDDSYFDICWKTAFDARESFAAMLPWFHNTLD
eukprot:SAG31_NODE_16482_length_707_cov_1.583882_1_plen_94_part_00